MIYIYALIDPRTTEIRYIGKTINPKDRFRHHISKARRATSPKEHSKRWIKTLLNEDLLPIMQILLTVEQTEWEYYEIEVIKLFNNLTNMTEGGQSVWWSKLSLEEQQSFRDKMKVVNKERPISDETREIWRQNAIKTHTGRKCTVKHKKLMSEKMKGSGNHRFGTVASKETREKLSKAHKGQKRSEETKLKYRKLQTELNGVKVNQYDLDGNYIATFNSTADAGRATSTHHSNIIACCKGRLKKTGGFIWNYA